MARIFATLAFAAAFTAANAQQPDVTINVTEAMTAKAAERTELVSRTVGGLNQAQRTEIQAAYLEMEKYSAALDARFATQPKEVRDADMPAQVENMDRYVNEKLATILTKEQLATWQEASR